MNDKQKCLAVFKRLQDITKRKRRGFRRTSISHLNMMSEGHIRRIYVNGYNAMNQGQVDYQVRMSAVPGFEDPKEVKRILDLLIAADFVKAFELTKSHDGISSETDPKLAKQKYTAYRLTQFGKERYLKHVEGKRNGKKY